MFHIYLFIYIYMHTYIEVRVFCFSLTLGRWFLKVYNFRVLDYFHSQMFIFYLFFPLWKSLLSIILRLKIICLGIKGVCGWVCAHVYVCFLLPCILFISWIYSFLSDNNLAEILSHCCIKHFLCALSFFFFFFFCPNWSQSVFIAFIIGLYFFDTALHSIVLRPHFSFLF